MRETLFALFFPGELVSQYSGKSKSNLTWFFNNDPRNKSVRRSLAALLARSPRAVIDETHRRCRDALWPRPGEAVFDARALKAVLGGARLGALNARWRGLDAGGEAPSGGWRLDVFFDADPSAALARMILTLSVMGDVPGETIGEIWRGETGGECAFLRDDATVEGQIRYGRMLDLEGRREQAFAVYERVSRQLGRPAQTLAESAMYCRRGDMLAEGEGCLRDERAAMDSYRLARLGAHTAADSRHARHALGRDAREALERASALGYGPAIRELGDALYNGSARLGCARSVEAARKVYQRGLALSGGDGAHCAFMLGRIYESQGERTAAVGAYRVARENGSAEAAQRLAKLDWTMPGGEAGKSAGDDGPRYCLTNAPTGCNRRFLESLPGRWDARVCCVGENGEAPGGARPTRMTPDAALRELAQGVYWGGAPQFPRLVIALLSDDKNGNLYQAIAVLGELQRLAQALGDRAWDLVDCVELYVLADHDYAALLLDAAFAGMGPLYFRVRVWDPAAGAAATGFAPAPRRGSPRAGSPAPMIFSRTASPPPPGRGRNSGAAANS